MCEGGKSTKKESKEKDQPGFQEELGPGTLHLLAGPWEDGGEGAGEERLRTRLGYLRSVLS